MDSQTMGRREFQQAGGTQDWRALAVQGVAAWFAAPSGSAHASGAALARRMPDLAAGRRRPDLDLRAGGIQVWIPDDPRLTVADVELARDISAAAAELGLKPDPRIPQSVELGIDTVDQSAVAPFWQTVLGYTDTDGLLDPLRRDPRFWFQPAAEHRPLRNRIHVDVAVPVDVAKDRLTALRAAGNRVSTGPGGYHALVTDRDGNEADLLTVLDGGDRLDGPDLDDWRVLFEAAVFYPVTDLGQATGLAAGVAAVADESEVSFTIDIRATGVRVGSGKDLWEDDRFPEAARRVQQVARALELRAEPSGLRFVQIGLDAVDVAAVREFWRAVLGYGFDPRPYVTDINHPQLLGPPLFVSSMDAAEVERREQRNRIHVDLFVPSDQVRNRVDAALAAGGRIADDRNAPQWWTIADPEGNEVDIATAVGLT